MLIFRPSGASEQPEDVLRAGLLQNHQLLLVGIPRVRLPSARPPLAHRRHGCRDEGGCWYPSLSCDDGQLVRELWRESCGALPASCSAQGSPGGPGAGVRMARGETAAPTPGRVGRICSGGATAALVLHGACFRWVLKGYWCADTGTGQRSEGTRNAFASVTSSERDLMPTVYESQE